MGQNTPSSATVEIPVEAGQQVYDSEGCRVGLVEDVHADEENFSILQAGLPLGWLGGEFIVPQRLVVRSREDSITLNLTAAELEAHRVTRN